MTYLSVQNGRWDRPLLRENLAETDQSISIHSALAVTPSEKKFNYYE